MNRDTPPPEWYDPPCDPEWSHACDDVEAAVGKLELLSKIIGNPVDVDGDHRDRTVYVSLGVRLHPCSYDGLSVLCEAEHVFRKLAMECRALRHQHVKEDMEAKGLGHARNFPEG